MSVAKMVVVVVGALALAACASNGRDTGPAKPFPDDARETRLTNVRQLTFSGENAEAYWAWSGDELVFQVRERLGLECDQIFTMGLDGSAETLVSTGAGRTTCAYFLPGDEEIVYCSTHAQSASCPTPPERTPGMYTWPLYSYDIYRANADGTNVRRLTNGPGYHAEVTSRADGRLLFTSDRDGDLDIYSMNADGSDMTRLTNLPGYDGGPFYSHDGTKVCYRAYHPDDPQDLEVYRDLLAKDLVRPTRMDIWVMKADGSGQRQVTSLPGASFSPFWHPDNKRIIFASNYENPRSRNFDIYLINEDGTGLEKVTHNEQFDCFPMFSPDGKQLVWCSNRLPGEDVSDAFSTNVFIADWNE